MLSAKCLFGVNSHGGNLWEQKRGGEGMQKIRIEQHTFMGAVWCAAWLFTIGFLHLTCWKGFLRLSGALKNAPLNSSSGVRIRRPCGEQCEGC
jgi:hypothetical protein